MGKSLIWFEFVIGYDKWMFSNWFVQLHTQASEGPRGGEGGRFVIYIQSPSLCAINQEYECLCTDSTKYPMKCLSYRDRNPTRYIDITAREPSPCSSINVIQQDMPNHSTTNHTIMNASDTNATSWGYCSIIRFQIFGACSCLICHYNAGESGGAKSGAAA